MKINLFNIDELSQASGIAPEKLLEWTGAGILSTEGFTGDSAPAFGGGSLETVRKISTLLELGYDLEEIKKIVRKVGLPSEKGQDKSSPKGKENFLTVGALAESSGISPRTIKHWEEKGIIEPDLRSQGGFRLYRDYYVFFCNLIRDLQLFGYSLDEIKTISDYFRDFITLRDKPEQYSPIETESRLAAMDDEITKLFSKTEQLRNGIKRWEDLLKKQKKQMNVIKDRNRKRRGKE